MHALVVEVPRAAGVTAVSRALVPAIVVPPHCVLAPEQNSGSGANLAARLVAAIREEVVTPDTPPIGVSVGVAACPEQGEDAERLLESADQAMYRAKAAGEAIAASRTVRIINMARDDITS